MQEDERQAVRLSEERIIRLQQIIQIVQADDLLRRADSPPLLEVLTRELHAEVQWLATAIASRLGARAR